MATIIVKCPKPDCFFVNIEDIAGLDPDNPRCALVCENASATFFATYNPSSTYTWTVTGGTFVPGANAAAIDISWGPMGLGAVSLSITNSGVTTIIDACVVIMEGPVAAFTTSSTSICKNSSVTFNSSTSTGASSYFWDFGDGTTSSAPIETHTYTTAGTHTACLIVTRNNFDSKGNPLCCCSDTTCVDIIVDPLEGPNIFCVSTLCAKDSTKYWTDAKNCGSYTWTVLGSSVPFTGQGTDTICVQWGAGPVGTVTLEVMGCDDLYCEEPVTVIIPIIPPTILINGEKVVCANATETYTVPKWISVYYDWEVMGAISWTGEGTNTITVNWGSASPGTITLNYYSDFLGGLPGHDPADCMGTAMLQVDIKPRFSFGPHPGVVCTNTMSTFSATMLPWSMYNWTISGTPTFTGDGTDVITVSWGAVPGTFVITATPTDATVYCNDVVTMIVKVVDVPKPLGIDGPEETCPGDTYTYFAQTDQTGVNFNWSVTNGTLSSTTGNPVTVTWGATDPYVLGLQQIMAFAPACSSAVFMLNVEEKILEMPTITGQSPVCVNSVWGYTAGPSNQHAEATYHWTFEDPTMGSVAAGQGTPNVQVQWNDIASVTTTNLILTVKLCSSMFQVAFPVEVDNPNPPTIAQNNTVCPGFSFMLSASNGYQDYLWSTLETTQTITVSTVGEYTVMVTELNGCKSSSSYTAVALSAPPSKPPGHITICVLPCNPSMVTINAPSSSSLYSYAWACNGTTQGTTAAFLVHPNTCIIADFLYTVTLTDANGCTSTSETTVSQKDVCGGSCTPEAHTLSFATSNPPPDCNTVVFTATTVNASLIGWDFGDLSSPGGPLTPISHTYTQAGSYTVTLSAQVANMNPPPDFCLVTTTKVVDIPLVAKFSCTSSCLTATFTDESSFNLPGDIPNSWAWTFGDGGTSGMQHPTHPYTTPGTYTVTLTVMNMANCKSTFTKTITVGGVSVDGIEISPDTVCVGTPLTFCGINPLGNITQWAWKFADGSTNGGPKPFHTYLSPGTYKVMLTVTDDDGCTDMVMLDLVVNPLPADDIITAIPGLTICDSSTTTLMVTSVPGYTYLWSDAGASTTNSIVVTQAGTYSVTITNAEGCTTVPDPVTVVVIPLPQATISGTHFICDNGCVGLSVPVGQNYMYLWSTGQTSSTINACSGSLQSPYSVTVTEPFLNCTAVSAPFDVSVVASPMFSIAIAPGTCEGTPNTLSIMSPQQDVIYAWSNGTTGTSIIVTKAGTYYAVGTNTITGCTRTASAVIHPLPNLCLVPVGCYEVCNPDTICGPSGLTDYQWNKDGAAMLGENDSCLIVTQSGTYSLTGTNEFGCMLTSDSLMLTVIDCTCYGLSASATPAGTDSCCWKLSYNNPLNTLYKLKVHSNDADLGFSGLSGLFSSVGGSNSITLSNAVSSALPLASSVLSNFITVCLSNVVSTPQQIIFDWYGVNGTVLCSDTVELYSQHFLVDTIFLCPGETILLGGNPYTAPDIVMVTLPGAGGECDTLATYHLLLSPTHTITLNCPPNITVNAVPGETTAVVNYPAPTATSTCPGSVPTLIPISGLPSGNPFPLGETEVCFIAKDNENCCSKPDTCCFIVTVTNEDPCDVAMIACIKYELMGITKDLAGNQTYRWRVTNNCANNLINVAFQMPDGITANTPANNAVYTAPSGRPYIVRNPNFTPYYSIRFKSVNAGISNGGSDIFEYTLPPQVCQGCILANVRLAPKIFYQAYLCCMMPSSLVVSPIESPVVYDLLEPASEVASELTPFTNQFAVFPNPTDGTLFADLSAWEGEQVRVQIYNSQGQQVQSLAVRADDTQQQLIEMPKGLADGLYFLEVLTANGKRQMARFVLHR
ncbi:MAG: PKD domain-containing protein [Saprospiraceae bacterium]